MTPDLFAIRSVLFLPASNPRAIDKARASAADMVVLDLEDAVKPDDKEAARAAAVKAVAEAWPMPVAIRVNGIASEWCEEDAAAVAGSSADMVVVPRVDSAEAIRAIWQVTQRGVLAMVETAAGVLAAKEIAGEAAALIVGTNDLSADLRLPPGAGRQPLQMALQSAVLAARAAGVPVFDGVFNDLEDVSGFTAECEESRWLGFDGKSLIHPSQIEPCNRAFLPSDEEVDHAHRLIDAFGGGAERFEGRMIERMHVDAARRLIERARG